MSVYRSTDSEYYIQDTRFYWGDYVVWWGPNNSGYTVDLDKAGLYTLEEAERIEQIRGTDKKWHRRDVEQAIVRAVDVGRLRASVKEAA